MLAAGYTPSQHSYSKLMSGYAFHGAPEVVRQLIEEMGTHSIAIERMHTSALLEAYLNR